MISQNRLLSKLTFLPLRSKAGEKRAGPTPTGTESGDQFRNLLGLLWTSEILFTFTSFPCSKLICHWDCSVIDERRCRKLRQGGGNALHLTKTIGQRLAGSRHTGLSYSRIMLNYSLEIILSESV